MELTNAPKADSAAAQYEMRRGTHADFIKSQTDKIILLTLFFSLLGCYLYGVVHGHFDAPSLAWLQGKTSDVISAILAVLGAKAWNARGGTPTK